MMRLKILIDNDVVCQEAVELLNVITRQGIPSWHVKVYRHHLLFNLRLEFYLIIFVFLFVLVQGTTSYSYST